MVNAVESIRSRFSEGFKVKYEKFRTRCHRRTLHEASSAGKTVSATELAGSYLKVIITSVTDSGLGAVNVERASR